MQSHDITGVCQHCWVHWCHCNNFKYNIRWHLCWTWMVSLIATGSSEVFLFSLHCALTFFSEFLFWEFKEVCSYSYTKRGIARLYCGDIKSDSGDSFVEKEAVLLKLHLAFARVTFHGSIEPVLSSGFACSLSSHSAIFRFSYCWNSIV